MVEASNEPTSLRQGLIPANVLLVPEGMRGIVDLYVVLDPSLRPEDGNIEGVVLRVPVLPFSPAKFFELVLMDQEGLASIGDRDLLANPKFAEALDDLGLVFASLSVIEVGCVFAVEVH